MQAGTSRAGKQFAAQHAEAVFLSAHAPAVCAKNIAELRQIAKDEFGRDPANIKTLALVTPILGKLKRKPKQSWPTTASMHLMKAHWPCSVAGQA